MEDSAFDAALITAAFGLGATLGWRGVTVIEAARDAGLDLARARARFPSEAAILVRFGVLADQAALAEADLAGPIRDRLFDLLMRRIDFLQIHRGGVVTLIDFARTRPALGALLLAATKNSMGWMLQGAGVNTSGLRGELRRQGMTAVWLQAMRAWEKDESTDLAATMKALDEALSRAEKAVRRLRGRGFDPAEADAPTQAGATETEPGAGGASVATDDLPSAALDVPPDPPPSPAI